MFSLKSSKSSKVRKPGKVRKPKKVGKMGKKKSAVPGLSTILSQMSQGLA